MVPETRPRPIAGVGKAVRVGATIDIVAILSGSIFARSSSVPGSQNRRMYPNRAQEGFGAAHPCLVLYSAKEMPGHRGPRARGSLADSRIPRFVFARPASRLR